jgi:hypothetical protein
VRICLADTPFGGAWCRGWAAREEALPQHDEPLGRGGIRSLRGRCEGDAVALPDRAQIGRGKAADDAARGRFNGCRAAVDGDGQLATAYGFHLAGQDRTLTRIARCLMAGKAKGQPGDAVRVRCGSGPGGDDQHVPDGEVQHLVGDAHERHPIAGRGRIDGRWLQQVDRDAR